MRSAGSAPLRARTRSARQQAQCLTQSGCSSKGKGEYFDSADWALSKVRHLRTAMAGGGLGEGGALTSRPSPDRT
jgi:hypothetical protein